MTSGVSAVVRAGADTTSSVSADTEETLLTGDDVVEQWGAISALRNLGEERAWVLVMTIVQAASGDDGEPIELD